MRESHEKIYLNIYSNTSKARLQSKAVFDKISGAEKPEIINASTQNRCQVRSRGELWSKSNKIYVKNNEN